MHNKLPCDDNLRMRGCVTVSMCSLCGSDAETSEHLFLKCSYALPIWSWLSNVIHCNISISSFNDIFSVCSRNWSSHVSVWAISKSRNCSRFDNKVLSSHSAIHLVKALVSMSGSQSSGLMPLSISEFSILKSFKVVGHASKALSIEQVLWHLPLTYWIKCNTDRTARGSPGVTACGGIFRDRMASALGCFALNIGVANSVYTELIAAIVAIEIASKNGWTKLW